MLLWMIKQLAVNLNSVFVRRSDFLSTRQDLTENTRAFAACLKEKSVHVFTPVLAQRMTVIKKKELILDS